jgi:predicted lysophospholipase L1 biosynthesis ABC-type transport system permease subunit
MSPDGAVVGRRFWWTDPYFGAPQPRRIVGVVEDADDENVIPRPALAIYHPFQQMPYGCRLLVKASGDPYALVPAVTGIIRDLSAEQPVARPATLADVRAEVLGPERLNTVVLSLFAGVALIIAIVGVAGVLAFAVSERTREFGVRLAIGSRPRQLLVHVVSEGARIAALGIAAGAVGSLALGRIAVGLVHDVQPPAILPLVSAAAVLTAAVVAASLFPAARAARVDVTRALRSE